jgi:NAD+ synthase
VSTPFSNAAFDLDLAAETERIASTIRTQVLETLRRRGVVVGLSGGIDSSVVAALAVRALGPEKVFVLFMPDRHSSDDSLRLGRLLADTLKVSSAIEDISPVLEATGCYTRQEEAIRSVVAEYGVGWKCKLVLPPLADSDRLNVTRLVVESPTGAVTQHRLPPAAYLQLVAATNFKQRTRKTTEYYHADRLHYAVAGTPNRLEYDQGFFVKQGDGAADVKPIAHLYKTQVYALARHLGLPDEICSRAPTTDTFSMAQTQDEFYFPLPYAAMDLCLYARNNGVPATEVAKVAGLEAGHVERVFRDIDAKRRATRYLHYGPLLVEPVAEV